MPKSEPIIFENLDSKGKVARRWRATREVYQGTDGTERVQYLNEWRKITRDDHGQAFVTFERSIFGIGSGVDFANWINALAEESDERREWFDKYAVKDD